MKVSRVIRIHNRFLKNRFDRCVREVNAARTSASAIPCAVAAPGKSTATATSPSGGAADERAATSQRQQPQAGSSGGYSPSRLQRSQSGAEACSARDGLNDENKGRLEGEGSERRDAHGGEGGNHPGSSVSTNGLVWRNTQGSDTPRVVGVGGSSRSGPMSESPSRRNAAERAAAVDRGATGTASGSESDVKSSTPEGERKKGDKRSSSPSKRSLEYLFFTGRRGGTAGISWSIGGRELSGGGGGNRGSTSRGTAGACDDNAYESWIPDLLKLAEDGFRLPDWSETDTDTETDTATSGETASLAEPSAASAKGASHPSSHPTPFGESTSAAAGSKAPDRSGREEDHVPSRPRSIVLSTHLSKTDIPGISRDAALAAAAQTSKVNSSGVAPPASIGLGNGEFVSPVCRVLVVKVYTGRTYRLPCGAPSGSDGGAGAGWRRGSSSNSNVGGVPRPSVLREAWTTGFKAVCVGEDHEVGEGGERGHGSDERESCFKKAPSRYQVSYAVASCMYYRTSTYRAFCKLFQQASRYIGAAEMVFEKRQNT